MLDFFSWRVCSYYILCIGGIYHILNGIFQNVSDNDPRVIVSMSMVGIQMVYKSSCCRRYSCWLCWKTSMRPIKSEVRPFDDILRRNSRKESQ